MTHPCIRRILIGMALTFAAGSAAGQTVVYDPSNYAQNVLQAARALQQINNQVTSLQNQTQMLLNQVRNLTSLPYSALQTIDQSIVRTQQLSIRPSVSPTTSTRLIRRSGVPIRRAIL